MSQSEINQFVEDYITETSTIMIDRVNKQKDTMKTFRYNYLKKKIDMIISDMGYNSLKGFSKSVYQIDSYDFGPVVVKILNSYGYSAKCENEDKTEISVSLVVTDELRDARNNIF